MPKAKNIPPKLDKDFAKLFNEPKKRKTYQERQAEAYLATGSVSYPTKFENVSTLQIIQELSKRNKCLVWFVVGLVIGVIIGRLV